jgi:Protein of unknown function (DUF3040)
MTLPYRQRRRLRGIDRMLRRSDPDLASMLSIFGHLGAVEQLPSREQLPASRPWARALVRLVDCAAFVLVCIAAGGLIASRRAAAVGSATFLRLARGHPGQRRRRGAARRVRRPADAGP